MKVENKNTKRPVALFDFDGTIIRRDSLLPFLRFLVARYPKSLKNLLCFSLMSGPYFLGFLSKEQVKSFIMKAFCCVPREKRQAFLEEFHRRVLKTLYFQGALDRIQWHKEQGHRLVMVSASLDIYLQTVADHLGFDVMLGTQNQQEPIPVVVGKNCWGPEKVCRLKEQGWFDETDWAASWSYSDHLSDLPMLMLCGHPVAVSPIHSLRKHAQQHNWTIFDWA
jgi:HAD superfamily hydrolase (TIGR01490 family)